MHEEMERQLIERYVAGENVRSLAVSFSVAVQSIYNILERHDVRLRVSQRSQVQERLLEAVRRGVSVTQAAKIFNISKSTATRMIRERRLLGDHVIVKQGRPDVKPIVHILNDSSDSVNEHYERLRWSSFPYPLLMTKETIDSELTKIRSRRLHVVNNEIRPRSPMGINICKPFFPHRYEAISKGSVSALTAWRSESDLKRAIRFQLDHGDPVTPHRVLRAITLCCRTPTIFKPLVARFIYERYCSAGGFVWDPCAGYGGRLLGAYLAGVYYVGTDVDDKTIEGNKKLADVIGSNVELRAVSAEIFNPPIVDLVFTSPPYFDRERYSQLSDQSWKKHGSGFDAWIKGFLAVVVRRAFDALSKNGYLVLNVADLKERGQVIPIVMRTLEVARESGFCHVETLQMPIAAINRKNPTEPILVFKKLN